MNDQSKLQPIPEEPHNAEDDDESRSNVYSENNKVYKPNSKAAAPRSSARKASVPLQSTTGLLYMAMGGLLWIANKATAQKFPAASFT